MSATLLRFAIVLLIIVAVTTNGFAGIDWNFIFYWIDWLKMMKINN